MRAHRALTIILVLALASLACSFSIDMPSVDFNNGDQVDRNLTTEVIELPRPDEEPVSLQIAFAAGELYIEPGAEAALVQGTARYDLEQLAPETSVSGGRVTLASGEIENLNDFDFNFDLSENPFASGFNDVENRWDLTLSSEPMSLDIAGGAYQGRVELGGLALTDLSVSSGASDLELTFSEPNQTEMDLLSVSTGASSTGLYGLVNANAGQLEFSGGAGDFTLDFSGELSRDIEVTIDAALSNLRLVIPQGLSTRLEVSGALANVEMPEGFSRSNGVYVQAGTGPTLTIDVELGAGNLEIERP